MHIKTFKKTVAIFMLFAFLCQPAAAFAGGLVDVGDATDYAYSSGASDWNSSGSRTAGQSAEIVGSTNLFLRSPYSAYCTLTPGDKLYHYGFFDNFFDGPDFDYSDLNDPYALRPALNLGSSLFLSATQATASHWRTTQAKTANLR